MRKNWPDFFIVGAPRAGTTSLYSHLNRVDGIFFPKYKEPNFFSTTTSKKHFFNAIRNEKKYLKLFEKSGDQLKGEASPSYLRDPNAPHLIFDANPDAKIIIILRNPAQRTFSHYVLGKALHKITTPFSELIRMQIDNEWSYRIMNSSMYYEQVKRYVDTFGRSQVKILIFEEFVRDTRLHVQDILNFLGVNGKIPKNINKQYHQTVRFKAPVSLILKNYTLTRIISKFISRFGDIQPGEFLVDKNAQKPKIAKIDEEFLNDLYRKDVEKLEILLGRSLPWDMSSGGGGRVLHNSKFCST